MAQVVAHKYIRKILLAKETYPNKSNNKGAIRGYDYITFPTFYFSIAFPLWAHYATVWVALHKHLTSYSLKERSDRIDYTS